VERWLGLRLVRVGVAAGCILIADADTLQLQSNRPSLDSPTFKLYINSNQIHIVRNKSIKQHSTLPP
jgi:hypothetical protein